MNATRGELLLLAIGILCIAALTLASSGQQQHVSTYSSYDTGPNGYRALYEVMRREGVRTRRFEAQLATLHRFSGTLLLSPSDFERWSGSAYGVMDAKGAAHLAQLVRGGARLVVLGNVLERTGTVLGLPRMVPIRGAVTAQRAGSSAYTGGVRSVAATFSHAFAWHGRRRVQRLLLARGTPVAVAYALGRGSVVAITAPGLFSNALLARAQNARFAYDVLSGTSGVLFDERLHGYATGRSMWEVLPATVHDATWIALAALLLAIIGGSFRSAPPVVLESPRLPDSSAYLASMATLLRQAHASDAAIERFTRGAARAARLHPAVARRAEVASELAQLESVRLHGRTNDDDVLEGARLAARLRSAFGAL